MKPDVQDQYAVWFLKTAAALLLVTGLAKVVSGFGRARVLALQDPILAIPFGKLLPVVGVIETLVALACFSNWGGVRLKLGLVGWMATNFMVYRIGLWCIGWHHPCGCMGSLAGALHLSDRAADRIMKGALIYLLAGSYLLMLKQRQTRLVVIGRDCVAEAGIGK